MTMRKSFLNLGLGVVGGCLAFVAIDTIRGESAAPVSQLEIASPAAVRPVSLASNTALPVGGAGSVDLREAAKKTVPAVVHVKTVQMGREYIGNPLLEFFYGYAPRTRETPQRMGIGSGVIVSEDGYIITNNHVIDKSDKITVTLDNKTEYEAKVIGTDPSTDIALLKVEANGLPYLEYANSDDVELGEWVLAVGNPYNLTSTVTAGIISAKARELGINRSQMSLESFLQTDDHMFGLTCAKKYGGVYVPPHQAVIHQFAREMLAGGGKMILGSDSHTRYGALGTMANIIGIGPLFPIRITENEKKESA